MCPVSVFLCLSMLVKQINGHEPAVHRTYVMQYVRRTQRGHRCGTLPVMLSLPGYGQKEQPSAKAEDGFIREALESICSTQRTSY